MNSNITAVGVGRPKTLSDLLQRDPNVLRILQTPPADINLSNDCLKHQLFMTNAQELAKDTSLTTAEQRAISLMMASNLTALTVAAATRRTQHALATSSPGFQTSYPANTQDVNCRLFWDSMSSSPEDCVEIFFSIAAALDVAKNVVESESFGVGEPRNEMEVELE